MTKCWRHKARRWQERRCCTCASTTTRSRSRAGCSSVEWMSNAKAAVDADGFGGHTALFATVVSQPNFWMNLHAPGEGRQEYQNQMETSQQCRRRSMVRAQVES